jgi:hypothetical protein
VSICFGETVSESIQMEIRSFCGEELKELYRTGKADSILPALHSRIMRRLFALRAATTPAHAALPAYGLTKIDDTRFCFKVDDKLLLFRIEKNAVHDVALWPSVYTKVSRTARPARPIETIATRSFQSCFISYGQKDREFADKLHNLLTSRGITCWLDEHDLRRPGGDAYDEISKGVQAADKLILCCSKNALHSWWVDFELTEAFDKEQQLKKKRRNQTDVIIPLDLDGYILTRKWKNGKERKFDLE